MHLTASTYYQINLLPEEAKQLKDSLVTLSLYLQEEYDGENPMPEAIAGVSTTLGPILKLLNGVPQQ